MQSGGLPTAALFTIGLLGSGLHRAPRPTHIYGLPVDEPGTDWYAFLIYPMTTLTQKTSVRHRQEHHVPALLSTDRA